MPKQSTFRKIKKKANKNISLIQKVFFNKPKRITDQEDGIRNKIKQAISHINLALIVLILSTVFLVFTLLYHTPSWNTQSQTIITSNTPHPSANNKQITESEIEIKNEIESEKILEESENTNNTQTPEDTNNNTESETQTTTPIKDFINNFYNSINQQKYNSSDYFDRYMLTSNTVQRYLSNTSMNRLWANLYGDIIVKKVSYETLEEAKKWEVKYSIFYTLSNGDTFQEDRFAIVLKQWEDIRIWSIRCESHRCSMWPFFQPSRHNIR